ncbi:MAG: metallophosphoesterase [Bdellovibrionota bacterium]
MKNFKTFLISCLLLFVSFSTHAQTPSYWSLALVGDAGVTGSAIQNLRKSIAQQKVNQVVLLGDNLYSKSQDYPLVWDPWKQLGFNFFAVAIGNHGKEYKKEIAYFGMPAEFYTLTNNGVRFIVLNSDNVKKDKEQALFLDTTLNQATEKQIYLIYHHASVTVSDNHSWPEKAPFQNLVRPLIAKYHQKITALLNGHDHVASLLDVSGIPLIVSGATWETLPPKVINGNDGLFQVKTLWNYPGGSYWVRMNFANDGTRTCAQFIRVDRPEISLNVQLYPRGQRGVTNCN